MSRRAAEDPRRLHLSALLREVHLHGPASRTALAATLGLNRSTIGDLVGDLVGAGLVTEGTPPAGPARVGRPSLVVSPSPAGASVVALYLDVHRLRAAHVGLGGAVLSRSTRALVPGTPLRDAAALAAGVVVEHLGRAGVPARADAAGPAGLVGVGVAVPGTVHHLDGSVQAAPDLGWADAPLAGAVRGALRERGVDVAVAAANDADLGMLAEQRRGAARGSGDALYLCGTWDLGGGIITGGHPLTGSRGFAGEVSHVGVEPGGRACRCGSRGCWGAESMAGAWAAALDLDASRPDVAARVAERLLRGDVAARRTRDRVSRAFARGLASTVNLLDPSTVILGAGLWRDLWPALAGDVVPWVERTVMPAMRGRVAIVPGGLGEDSTLLGAAETALAPLLADPLALAPALAAGGPGPAGQVASA